LAGIMLTLLILTGLAIAALVATGLFIAQNVRVNESGARGETTVETPFASLRVRDSSNFDPALVGLPVYPGAVREPDSRKVASFHLDLGRTHKAFAVAAAEYRTNASPDRVAEFYRHEFPHWLFSEKDGGGMQLELNKGGYRKIIAIHTEDGETRIGLASVGEPASN
jgi:hypothetical protein